MQADIYEGKKGFAMKVEVWNEHEVRFVEQDGQWWAVAADVCAVLGHTNTSVALAMVDDDERCLMPKKSLGIRDKGQQDISLVSETGLYVLIIRSNLPEAKVFRKWVCEIIKKIREEVLGLKAYEAFRLMDKEHQKEAMRRLSESLHEPVKVDYIKANTIADKAVSTKHGYSKLVKKSAMSAEMLKDRQAVLADTVEALAFNEKHGLGLSVSGMIYAKHGGKG